MALSAVALRVRVHPGPDDAIPLRLAKQLAELSAPRAFRFRRIFRDVEDEVIAAQSAGSLELQEVHSGCGQCSQRDLHGFALAIHGARDAPAIDDHDRVLVDVPPAYRHGGVARIENGKLLMPALLLDRPERPQRRLRMIGGGLGAESRGEGADKAAAAGERDKVCAVERSPRAAAFDKGATMQTGVELQRDRRGFRAVDERAFALEHDGAVAGGLFQRLQQFGGQRGASRIFGSA